MKRSIKKSKGKVFVGMSGGVDSSVVAALLQKENYEVVGVFIKVWQPDFLSCTWRNERLDAMRVAAHLNIPLLTWDFEKEYKEGVADYMIREYREGRTPNPDVMCNREVKFGAFFRRACEQGADFVATGHYAQIVYDKKIDTFKLFKGVDETKDQSYFLWTLGQKELRKTLFPIGGFKKSDVRALAKKFKLPVAKKKDSQGLCFVGQLDMKDFLAHFMEEKEGGVINEYGELIGTHRGAFFYTLGERHGFMINKKSAYDKPYYIVAKDLLNNTITVAHNEAKLSCASQHITALQANYCRGVLPDTNNTYTVQVRYHGELYNSHMELKENNIFSLFIDVPVLYDTGQSVVVYDNNECIGGGIIS